MMEEGVRLMVVGMFTVFAFLTLLVGLMKASAAFFEANAHRFPEEAPVAAKSQRSNDSKNDAEIAVAIALAAAMRRGQRV
jgi:sodium pump decarboxylase gamma subunit